MRKPRDYDSELKTLTDKAKALKSRKVLQLGELVIATGADALDPESLAGAFLSIAKTNEAKTREAWRATGAAFFRGQSRKVDCGTQVDAQRNQAGESNAQPH